jgi:hypothetical protein
MTTTTRTSRKSQRKSYCVQNTMRLLNANADRKRWRTVGKRLTPTKTKTKSLIIVVLRTGMCCTCCTNTCGPVVVGCIHGPRCAETRLSLSTVGFLRQTHGAGSAARCAGARRTREEQNNKWVCLPAVSFLPARIKPTDSMHHIACRTTDVQLRPARTGTPQLLVQ